LDEGRPGDQQALEIGDLEAGCLVVEEDQLLVHVLSLPWALGSSVQGRRIRAGAAQLTRWTHTEADGPSEPTEVLS
jgi:hypothetical protein